MSCIVVVVVDAVPCNMIGSRYTCNVWVNNTLSVNVSKTWSFWILKICSLEERRRFYCLSAVDNLIWKLELEPWSFVFTFCSNNKVSIILSQLSHSTMQSKHTHVSKGYWAWQCWSPVWNSNKSNNLSFSDLCKSCRLTRPLGDHSNEEKHTHL